MPYDKITDCDIQAASGLDGNCLVYWSMTPFECIWSGTRWYCLLLLHPAPGQQNAAGWNGRWMGGKCPWIETCREAVRKLWLHSLKRILYIHIFLLATSTAAKINHEPNSWWITWQWNGWLIFQMLCKIPLPSFTWFIYLSFHHMVLQQHLENLEEWICYHLVRSYFEVAPKIPQKDPRGSMVQLTWNCWWTKSILLARNNE